MPGPARSLVPVLISGLLAAGGAGLCEILDVPEQAAKEDSLAEVF